MHRRDFLRSSVAAALWLAAAPRSHGLSHGKSPLKLLVLGGTNFVGPAIVEHALAQGHEVTLFNRGITRPHLFPGVEKLRGDRTSGPSGLFALGDKRRWDAVIDTWPAEPSIVGATARLLAERVDYYYFVSSIAVYRDFSKPDLDEDAPLRAGESGYGGDKVAAEKLVLESFEGRAGVARCHSIFGPRDNGSTLHYWLRRMAEQDRVLAPGRGEDPVQFGDVRDLATWAIDCAAKRRAGIYNLARPPMSFRDFLETARGAVGSDAELVWVTEPFLAGQGIRSFDQMPLWVPLHEDPGFFQISSAKAMREGMRYRTPAETLSAAWLWYRSMFFQDTVFPHNGWGISTEDEKRLLAAWRDKNSS